MRAKWNFLSIFLLSFLLPISVFAQDPYGAIELSNGQSVSGSVAYQAVKNYVISVPSGATKLTLKMTGTNDADMYVKRAQPPTRTDWHAFLDKGGSNETIEIFSGTSNPPQIKEKLTPGKWYIMIYGYESGTSTYTLTATYTTGPSDPVSSSKPNLMPYKPDGWDYPIVASSVTGTRKVDQLKAGQTTYIDWAVTNDGEADIPSNKTFYTDLYIDGTKITSWSSNGLQKTYFTSVTDWVSTINFTAGKHTLKIVTDATGVIDESNETDNTYQIEFEWASDGSSGITRSITVTSPNGGENWTIGTNQTIQWTSSNAGSDVKIEITRDGGPWQVITSSTSNDGSYTWTVTSPASSNARIRITSLSYSSVSDQSNGSFTISSVSNEGDGVTTLTNGVPVTNISGSKGSQKFFKINVPSGAKNLEISTSGGSGDADLFVKRGQKPTLDNNDIGSYNDATNNEIIKSSSPSATDWYIMIYGYLAYSGVTLKASYETQVVQRSIAVVSPNGGESWKIGNSETIQWTSQNVTGDVKIEISRDGSWSTITSNTANDGSYNWAVTSPASSNVRIRITSNSYPSVSDVSNESFSIFSIIDQPQANLIIEDTKPVKIEQAAINQNKTTSYFRLSWSFPKANYDKTQFSFSSAKFKAKIKTPASNVKYTFVPIPMKSTLESLVEIGVGALPVAGWIKSALDALGVIFKPLGNDDTEFTIESTALIEPQGEQEFIAQVRSSSPRETWLFRVTGSVEYTVKKGLQQPTASKIYDYQVDLKESYAAAKFAVDIESLYNMQSMSMDSPIHNYPNPFNSQTQIQYFLLGDGYVSLIVYDLLGREVATVVSEHQKAGIHIASWSGLDNRGEKVASGVYIYYFRTRDFFISKKMLLLK